MKAGDRHSGAARCEPPVVADAHEPWEPDRWRFLVEEVAPGTWEAIGHDPEGGLLRAIRRDPDEAFFKVRDDAAEIIKRRRPTAAE